MSVQTSSIISSQIYREADKPLYRTGNSALIGVCIWNMILFVGAKVFYDRVNAYVARASEKLCHPLTDLQTS
jgi:hypothetical protein